MNTINEYFEIAEHCMMFRKGRRSFYFSLWPVNSTILWKMVFNAYKAKKNVFKVVFFYWYWIY